MLVVAGAALATLAAAPAGAGIDLAGTTAANFLSVGASPGVLAMGGAGLSLEGGLATFDWNPATLGRLGRTEAMFSHAALGDQNAQEWGAFGGRLRFAGLSGAVTGLFQNEGSFEGRDASNNPTGTFDASSMAIGLGIARAFGSIATAGVGMKYASENLGGVQGAGVTFDAGLQMRSGGFGLGAAAQNVFGKMSYDGAIYRFPANFGLGFSYEHPASGLRLALDVNIPAAYYSDVRSGVEWRWNDRFALRAGYRAELNAPSGEPLGGPTFGMGAGARGIWLDYGYLVGGAGTGQHRIGITFHPGGAALPPDGPEHRGNDYAHTSSDALPTSGTGAKGGSSEKPQARSQAGAPVAPSAPAPVSAHASAPASAPANAQASSGMHAHTPTSTSARPSAATGSTAAAPTSTSARPSAASTSTTTAPASPSARPSAASTSTTTAPASTSARPSAATGSSAAVRAPASASPSPSAPPNSAAQAPSRAPTVAAAPVSAQVAGPPNPPPAGTTPAASAKPDSVSPRPAAPRSSGGQRPEKVRVKNRQTMAEIARAYGTSVPAIMMENNMVTDQVRPGQVLKLPRK